MEVQTSMQNEPPKHSHVGLRILSFVLVVLTLALVAVAIYLFQQQELEPATPDANMQARITELEGQLETSKGNVNLLEEQIEMQEKDKIARFDGASDRPAFDYPFGWHVGSRDSFDTTSRTRTYLIDERPVFFCAACDGFGGAVVMNVQDKDGVDLGGFGTYIEKRTSEIENGAVIGGDVTFKDVDNGRLMMVSDAKIDVLGSTLPYEQAVFENNNYVITIFSATDHQPSVAAWNMIKNSLDFGAIQ